jgi:hypothetical protein
MSDTLVKNILHQVLSPRIVSNGSGGYTTKIDLKADRLLLNNRPGDGFNSGTGDGLTAGTAFTGQCGIIPSIAPGGIKQIYHRDVTPNSVILTSLRISYVASGTFIVINDGNPATEASQDRVGWFIAKY